MKKHKKRGILCAIGAVLFAAAISQMDASQSAEIVTAIVIALVLAFVAVRSLFPNLRLRKRSKASAAAVPRRKDPQRRSSSAVSRPLADTPMEKQPDAPRYQHYEFHVAGVTFHSDDGTPRQEYLRRIDNGLAPFENSASLDVSLRPYMYKAEGKPEEQAIAVRVNGYDIGNVPSKSVPAVMDAMRKPGATISAFKVIGGDAGKNYGAIVVVRHDL
ncbi:MAG: hypothetical protein Q4B32_05510 [Clostridia bacterium]|nr:hypothetical protein [Clostridia bacterium]